MSAGLAAAKGRGRVLARLALWTAGGFGAGLLIALAAPLAVGHRALTVLSGSMEPAIATGDVIVVESIEAAEARVGDIVTYRDQEGRLITHRVRRVRSTGGKAEFVTKGDANSATERWSIPADGDLGRAIYRIPMAGYARSYATSPPGPLLLVVLPLLLLAVTELRTIWRPGSELTRETTA